MQNYKVKVLLQQLETDREYMYIGLELRTNKDEVEGKCLRMGGRGREEISPLH